MTPFLVNAEMRPSAGLPRKHRGLPWLSLERGTVAALGLGAQLSGSLQDLGEVAWAALHTGSGEGAQKART